MPLPATTGQFRTNIGDMQIGDFIAFKVVGTSGVPCTISDIGAPLDTAQANEIPVIGSASPNGYAYAIKADKGVMISDRPIQHSVSWDALNTAKLIQGALAVSKPLIPLYDAPTPNVTASSVDGNDQLYNPFRLFNGDDTDYGWISGAESNPCVIVSLGSSLKVSSYELNPKPNTTGCGATWASAWNIYTSNEDIPVNWTLVDTQSNKSDSIRYRCFFKNPIYAKHIKIEVTAKTSNQYWSALCSFQAYGDNVLVRSITGGNSYLGTDGKSSLTDKGLGAFPLNEWDKYIVGSNLGGKITVSDDNVWHWNSGISTLCQDTSVASSSDRILRGCTPSGDVGLLKGLSRLASPTPYMLYAFRPVFQFLEPNSKASNLFY